MQKSPKWSENDFPPLKDMCATGFATDKDTRKWGDREVTESSEGRKIDGLSSHVETILPAASVAPVASGKEVGDRRHRAASESKSSIRSPSHDRISGLGYESRTSSPTPDPSLSPVTPVTPRTATTFLRTPKSSVGAISMTDPSSYIPYKSPTQYDTPGTPVDRHTSDESGRFAEPARELDRSTIFVGGLEICGPTTWDEPRLRNLFERYGNIENIQLVRPRRSTSLL